MFNRHGFLRRALGVFTDVICVHCSATKAFAQLSAPASAPTRSRGQNRRGHRIMTVDVHAHCAVPAVLDLVSGTPMERAARGQLEGKLGFPVEGAGVVRRHEQGRHRCRGAQH